ncbi:Uncharacterised protein [uncultured archaeon]|nr:Uncharacterised protein [uncultured archaeon]
MPRQPMRAIIRSRQIPRNVVRLEHCRRINIQLEHHKQKLGSNIIRQRRSILQLRMQQKLRLTLHIDGWRACSRRLPIHQPKMRRMAAQPHRQRQPSVRLRRLPTGRLWRLCKPRPLVRAQLSLRPKLPRQLPPAATMPPRPYMRSWLPGRRYMDSMDLPRRP